MAFYNTKVPNELIRSADWNAFVDFTEWISSNLYRTSSNLISKFAPSSLSRGYYFPSSLGKSLYSWSSNALTLYGASSHIHSIEDLSDVAVMTPTDGKALIWDSIQSKWQRRNDCIRPPRQLPDC